MCVGAVVTADGSGQLSELINYFSKNDCPPPVGQEGIGFHQVTGVQSLVRFRGEAQAQSVVCASRAGRVVLTVLFPPPVPRLAHGPCSPYRLQRVSGRLREGP